MRPVQRRIAIVGAGTAGAAAALFLTRQGHTVTLYERVPKPGPVGAGIMLQPTGLEVLRRLGLSETVLARTAPVNQLLCERTAGHTVFNLRYDALRPGLTGHGLHRGVLFQTLFNACLNQGIPIHTGVEIEGIERSNDTISCVTSSGDTLEQHDLVVVADGAVSELRDDTTIRKQVTTYPWGRH